MAAESAEPIERWTAKRRVALVIRILKLKLPRQGDTSKGELPAVDVGPVPRRFLPRTDGLSGGLMMTVEEVGTGWKLTYKVVGPDAPGSIVWTVLTMLDGKDVPLLVNGKPSGQTMGIKRIDSRHTVTVLRFQGKETGISKAEISPDGKVLKVENDYATSNPNGLVGKQIQYWDKQ